MSDISETNCAHGYITGTCRECDVAEIATLRADLAAEQQRRAEAERRAEARATRAVVAELAAEVAGKATASALDAADLRAKERDEAKALCDRATTAGASAVESEREALAMLRDAEAREAGLRAALEDVIAPARQILIATAGVHDGDCDGECTDHGEPCGLMATSLLLDQRVLAADDALRAAAPSAPATESEGG